MLKKAPSSNNMYIHHSESKLVNPSGDCVGNVGAGVNIELRYHVYNGSCVARPAETRRRWPPAS